MMTRMKTHTPIRAMAVSNTLLLGVRYNLALQLKRERGCEYHGDGPYAVFMLHYGFYFDRKTV